MNANGNGRAYSIVKRKLTQIAKKDIILVHNLGPVYMIPPSRDISPCWDSWPRRIPQLLIETHVICIYMGISSRSDLSGLFLSHLEL